MGVKLLLSICLRSLGERGAKLGLFALPFAGKGEGHMSPLVMGLALHIYRKYQENLPKKIFIVAFWAILGLNNF